MGPYKRITNNAGCCWATSCYVNTPLALQLLLQMQCTDSHTSWCFLTHLWEGMGKAWFSLSAWSRAVMFKALDILIGLLTSPEDVSASIFSLSQHKGATCLPGSPGNQLPPRSNTFQVTLGTYQKEFCFCLSCSAFTPEPLGKAVGLPPPLRVIPAPSPSH